MSSRLYFFFLDGFVPRWRAGDRVMDSGLRFLLEFRFQDY